MSEVSLKINSNNVSPEEFLESSEAFFGLIKDLARNITGKTGQIEQSVSVEAGSIIVKSNLQSKYDYDYDLPLRVVDTVGLGLVSLENKSTMPDYFDYKALKKLQKIAKYPNISIKINNDESIDITSNTATNIKSLFDITHIDFGSIEGKLQSASSRNGIKFTIYQELTEIPVKCSFDKNFKHDILRDAFDKRVTAYGEIAYNKEGDPQKLKVSELRILGVGNLPTWEDVRGILA